ncbi:hypothetical protein EDB19DRAFT_1943838 [Suillus lakei]|nr:hypothetical protein EDB19DRAFT_1943838 [Suillus lakei]
MSLSNLAISLRDKFQHRGVLSDLDESIKLNWAALFLRPRGHPDQFTSLNNLSLGIRDRFQHRGVLSDLDEALKLNQAALLLCPPGHLDLSMSLSNLAIILVYRFKQQHVPCDFEEAIELNRAALLLLPPGHSERFLFLHNLAVSLVARFNQGGIPSDLDEATELHQASLLLCPPGHSDQSMSLSNLAASLEQRFTQWGVPSDLDEAIELNQAVLFLRPLGHLEQSLSLHNLAVSLRKRFTQQGVPSDLDEAIELIWAALLFYPPGHSDRSRSLKNLAISLWERFKQRGIPSDLDEAIEFHQAALLLYPPASRIDLGAAEAWVALADDLKHPSALLAYKTALKFLDQQVALLSSSSRHFDVIREAISSLATDAFSCSVCHEQGRAVFWTQLARFNTPLDELSVSGDTGAALAEEFKRLSFHLHNAFNRATEDQSLHIRQLTVQWDEVISHICMLPDFSQFLLPPLFSDIQKAAEAGPAIIVNAGQHSCDALIILSGQDPVHVPLGIAQTEVSELSSEFQSLSEQFGSSNHQHKLVGILRKLWDRIVDPVVQALGKSEIRPGLRIWWCPTAEFTLLPLHAAGPYEKKRDNLSHIYISSNTPTLVTLIWVRQQGRAKAASDSQLWPGSGLSTVNAKLQEQESVTRWEFNRANERGRHDTSTVQMNADELCDNGYGQTQTCANEYVQPNKHEQAIVKEVQMNADKLCDNGCRQTQT